MSTEQRAAAFRADEAVVSPARLLVMLYDRLIRDLDDAEVSMQTGDVTGARFALLHAQEIVSELECALDPDTWTAAVELASIYVYLQARLIRANVHQSITAVQECRAATEPLREAWTKIWQEETELLARSGSVDGAHVALDVVG